MNTILQDSTNPIEVGSRLKFAPKELLILEADINYTNLHLVSGKKVIVSYHLGKLQERLASFECFIRPNRNTLVNINYIDAVADDCVMVGERQILMSRRRKELVLQMIRLFESKQVG